MDEKLVSAAAAEAVKDLELDCEVASVQKRKDEWCVKFSGTYGEFCDDFRGKFGEENSREVVREKIKRHLLKAPKPTGRRKGVSARSAAGHENSLLDLPLQLAEGAIEQTTRVAVDVIDSTVDLAAGVIRTATDAAQAIGQVAQEPPPLRASVKIAAHESLPVQAAPSAASQRKTSASKKTGKASKKGAARKPARKRATKK